jgi:hypothetical protein
LLPSLGHLSLMEKIVQIDPSLKQHYNSLALKIFHTCLFKLDSSDRDQKDLTEDAGVYDEDDLNYVKCKSNESRRSAYDLIIRLIRGSPENLMNLIQSGFNLLFKIVPPPSNWNFTPALDTKSSSGYIGLRNLGE